MPPGRRKCPHHVIVILIVIVSVNVFVFDHVYDHDQDHENDGDSVVLQRVNNSLMIITS